MLASGRGAPVPVDLIVDVVAAGCAAAGLCVHRIVEREALDLAADHLGVTPAALKTRMQRMGSALGPPWNEDIKLAVLAAEYMDAAKQPLITTVSVPMTTTW